MEILDYGVSRDVGYCIVMKCYSKTLKQWRLGWDTDDVLENKENEHLRRKSKNDLFSIIHTSNGCCFGVRNA